MADYLACSRVIIARLVEGGVLKPVERGRFDLRASVRAFAQHMRGQASGRAGAEATAAARAKSLEASARLKAAQTRAAEARLRKEAGELVEFTTHAAVMGEISGLFRRTMIALVPRITSAAHLTVEQGDKVQATVFGALKDLAEADVLEGLDLKLAETPK